MNKTFGGIWRMALLAGTSSLLLACAGHAPVPEAPAVPVISEPQPEQTVVAKPAEDTDTTGMLAEDAFSHKADVALTPAGTEPGLTVEQTRNEMLLRGANHLLKQEDYDAARSQLAKLEPEQLTAMQAGHYAVIQARLADHLNNGDAILDALSRVDMSALSMEQQMLVQSIRAHAYGLLGRHVAMVNERVDLDALLVDPAQQKKNRDALWRYLRQLTLAELKDLSADTSLGSESAGWVDLALIAKRNDLQIGFLNTDLDQWLYRYQAHPAKARIAGIVSHVQTSLLPTRIAVLLPESGPLASVADVLRHGLLHAYFAQREGLFQPELQFYDTSGPVASIEDVYRQVVADGAEFVIGPLDKPKVAWLAEHSEFVTPTLALNYLEQEGSTPKNFYQWGLLPEDEVSSLLRYARDQGQTRIGMLIPDNAWGQRLAEAVRKDWAAEEEFVAVVEFYPPKERDFAVPLQSLLQLQQSKRRAKQLKRMLRGGKWQFEPRSRQDLDALFVVAAPIQMRLIKPQLAFYHADQLPVYSMSQIYTGFESLKQDEDLDGTMIADLPWIVQPQQGARRTMELLWPGQAAMTRFYAMGMDALTVVSDLDYLRSNPEERHQGRAGALYMDDYRALHRSLPIAVFRGGRPVLIQRAEFDPGA